MNTKLNISDLFGIINIDYLIIGFAIFIIVYYLFLEETKNIIVKEKFCNCEHSFCPLQNKKKEN